MAWWLQTEHDGECGKRISYAGDWTEESAARIKAAEAQVAAEMIAKYFTPDPGPRPWPASPHDPILGTYTWTGFRHPMPDRPLEFRFEEKVDYLADCFGFIITDKIRDVIEGIEPDVHQYLPCKLRYRDGTAVPERRWLLNICNRLDTIAAEHSNILVDPADGYYLTGNGPFDVKLWKRKVAGHAIWSEWKYNNRTYVADALADAIRALDAHGWIFRTHLPEVDA